MDNQSHPRLWPELTVSNSNKLIAFNYGHNLGLNPYKSINVRVISLAYLLGRVAAEWIARLGGRICASTSRSVDMTRENREHREKPDIKNSCAHRL